MGKLDRYKIDFKGMDSGGQTFEWHIDDDFFVDVQSHDIQGGNVDVCLKVKPVGDAFQLLFHFEGEVRASCDRCLELMTLPVSANREVKAKWGDDYEDDGDEITISEGTGEVNVAWNIYEFISLEVPMRHVHPEGECSGEVDELLNQYETSELIEGKDDEGSALVDERWSGLKKILDNNK